LRLLVRACEDPIMLRTSSSLPRLAFVLSAAGLAPAAAVAAETAPAPVRTVALPGGGADGITMDYIAFDPATRRVWVPAGNTGAVLVLDTATGKVTALSGFPTKEVEVRGGKRTVGPSSVTIGRGQVYVGNRADFSVCAIDARSLARGACGTLDSMPDGIAYVAPANEVWVTTPRDKSVRVLDAATLAQKAKLDFDGQPEGFAVDAGRGRFYTNLEDKDRTLAIDVETRKTVATWNPSCGEQGPHGLKLDEKAGLLFVACSAKTEVLDAGHDGRVLSSVDTGDGVDDIDYAPTAHRLYVGAARAGQLTVAEVDPHGKLTVVARVPTPPGARNGVVALDGTVYLAHSGLAKLNELVVVPPAK
jgi:DNA-binding beta-propeller fold protein YncE